MNTTYIKMCKKAKKIQKLRNAVFESQTRDERDYDSDFGEYVGDWFWCENDFGKAEAQVLKYDNDEERYILGDYGEKWRRIIWLPTQDRLQEMLADKYPKLNEMVYFFWSWMERECAIEILGLTSMQQLWLAFVQKELYGLIWNREDWVKGGK